MHKKGKVLLVTPNLKGMNDGVNRIQPPLGPMIAADVIRRDYGHDVRIHDTALADLDNQNVDGVMRGEVDFAWPKLADAFIQGEDISSIPGLGIRDGTDYRFNPKPGAVDVKQLPLPARDFAQMERYFEIR